MNNDNVTRLAVSQLPDAAELLSRAFYNDPLLLYLYPDANERSKSGPRFFLPNIEHAARYNQMYTTGSFKGIAIWHFNGFEQPGVLAMADDPRSRLPESMGKTAFERLTNVVKCVVSMHKDLAPRQHYYLLFLGVDTPHQGKGTGSLLIKSILDEADKKGITCYLETNTEIDVKFYRKHGFDVGDQRKVPDGGPDVWGMVRRPSIK